MAIAQDIEDKERAATGTPTPPQSPSSAASAAKKSKPAKITDERGEGKTAPELPPASSSSSPPPPAPVDMSAIFTALLTGQQQMLLLLAQLVVAKKEEKELPPPLSGFPSFIQPGASSAPSSSSSSAGAQAAARYEQMQLTALGENRAMLAIHAGEEKRLRDLHTQSVGSDLPAHSFTAPLFPVNGGGFLGTGGGSPTPATALPLLHLPSRLRHIPASENPSTVGELLQRFLTEESKGTLKQKKIKSFDEWLRAMHEGIAVAAKAGHQRSVNQSLAYVTHMVDLNTNYGWPAAEFYWFELQKEVERGWHVLDSGSPWNATCMFAMTQKFQLLKGRPTTATSGTAAPATAPAAAAGRGRDRGGKQQQQPQRARSFDCATHGPNYSHNTAECRAPTNRRATSSVPANASSGGGGGAPAKHA